MAKGLFPPRGEVNANYDWVDLVSATGYVVYDGVNAKDSTGSNHTLLHSSQAVSLSKVTPYNNGTGHEKTLVTGFEAVGGGLAKAGDFDFDLSEFQLPRIIEGRAMVSFTVAGEAQNNVYAIAKLRKWDGASETEIASVQSETETTIGTGEDQMNLIMSITVPKTHFKKGEILRLTIEVWATSSAGDDLAIIHNPSNGQIVESHTGVTVLAGDTRLTLAVPFRLDFM